MDISSRVNQTQSVGEILQTRNPVNSSNVNNVDKYNSNNVTTLNVNVDLEKKEEQVKYYARELAEKLGDLKNLNFYLKCARENKPDFLYECLSITLIAKREGKITKTPAKYFVGVFKRRS